MKAADELIRNEQLNSQAIKRYIAISMKRVLQKTVGSVEKFKIAIKLIL